ncbi:MAG TPA: hypothetical protein VFV49_17040 [Thermoanaerobaculia bacterium]|nr:hypothetical protein [Thermoanaerobaculia bacterium]
MNRALNILRAAGVIVILAIVVRVTLLRFDRGDDVYKPRGYERIAQIFLRHGWIAIDPNGKATITQGAGEGAKGVYRRSFLLGDVEEFNAGKNWIFGVENQQIESVDTTRHNVLLPYSRIESWRGSLRYRGNPTLEGSLRGVGVDIRLDSLTRNLFDQVRPEEVVIRGNLQPEPLNRARGEVVNIYGQPRVYLGKVHLVGEKIVINNRKPPDTVSMAVSGSPLPQGNRAWLGPGDLLKLTWAQSASKFSRYALLWSEGGRSANVISAPCGINGRWSRCPEETALPLATDVIASLDAGVLSKTTRTTNDFDVVMTLDRELHEAVQGALERDRQQPKDAPTAGLDARRRETRAAVTVMDALTGELLALASYPTRTALARVDLPVQEEARLLRNHNFSRRPIGSVAKVLFGAAILDADPRLATLQLQQHAGDSIETVAGIHINPPVESHPVNAGADGVVDFREFIEQSSNEYAALLLTLASATRKGAPLPAFTGPELPDEGRYSIGGQAFDRTPSPTAETETRLNLTSDGQGRVVAGTLSNLEGEPWSDSFRKLFGVEKVITTPVEKRPANEGDQITDTAVWQPVLDRLYGERVPAGNPLRAVGFERENLALNLSHAYRTQLLSLMYGGAAARFTNPKLCEMFSRLVTGKKVERSLVLGVPGAGEELPRTPPRAFAPLELDAAVRDEVLHAMAAVSGPGGTAKSLYDTLSRIDRELAAKNQALGFFSKTGSPRNSIAVPNGLSRAINRLIASRAVALNAQGVMTYRGIPITDETEGGGDPRSLRAMRQNAADRRILASHGVGPRLAHDALLFYNVEPPERRNAIFTTRNGRVLSMQGVREMDATGAVYVFTIGVYPGAARRSDQSLDIDAVRHQPLRAWSVAITIEGQGKSTDVAVPFAETLLDTVLWPVLQQEPKR